MRPFQKNYSTTLRTAVKFVSKCNCNTCHCRVHTEQVAWVESILTCTSEVPGSDAHQHIVSFKDFRGLPQCPKANSGVGHDRLLSKPFYFIVCLSQSHLMLHNLAKDYIINLNAHEWNEDRRFAEWCCWRFRSSGMSVLPVARCRVVRIFFSPAVQKEVTRTVLLWRRWHYNYWKRLEYSPSRRSNAGM